jgi:hypothetical protein
MRELDLRRTCIRELAIVRTKTHASDPLPAWDGSGRACVGEQLDRAKDNDQEEETP